MTSQMRYVKRDHRICGRATRLLLILLVLLGLTVADAWAYPTSYGQFNDYEWITQVSFNNLSNASGRESGGYGNYTGLTANVSKLASYNLAVTIAPDANDFIYAWIDWNKDDDFTDPGEQYILASNTNNSGPHSQSITIPATAATGTTRMRISLKWNGAPSSGEIFSDGEVEDYSVLIQGSDSMAPAAIADLTTGAVTSSSITLNWTATGDDGNSGTATGYDVRYSTAPINSGNWASATQATGEPSPQAAGSLQSFLVSGLDPGTTYYFAVKTTDEAANESGLSNVPSGTTTSVSFCSGGNLVMVTANGTFDTRYDNQKRTLFQSWGYSVSAIDDDADPSAFTTAAAANDVMYISETVLSPNIGAKARDLDIGVVVEEVYLVDAMAFTSVDNWVNTPDSSIVILDNSHYITSGFSTGSLSVYTISDLIWGNDTTWATSGQFLARTPVASPAIYAFDTGDILMSGSPAANRRVSSHFFFGTNPTIWNDNLRTLLRRSLEWASCSGGVATAISGAVFEDSNYSGGPGRSLTDASGTARSNVTVELYNTSGGYISNALTNGSGNYSFTGLSAGQYTVRVANTTVTSSRSGATGAEIAVQTFRADSNGESAGTGTNKVGGEQPQSTDAAANTGSSTLAALQSPAGQYTQSVVTVDTSGGDVTDVDFGFNFDTIVNTNDSGQGSLRQFVLNANLLGNSGLDQDDWGVTKDPGIEHSIFMIPMTDSGYGPDSSGGGGNAFVIQLSSTGIGVLSDADTAIDGRTQTAFTGNTNGAVDNASTGPEVIIDFGNEENSFSFSSRGYLYDVGIYRSGANQAVNFENVATMGSVIQNVTICQSDKFGLMIYNSSGLTIADNVVRDSGLTLDTADGLAMNDSSNNIVTRNAFVANAGAGIEFWSGTSENNTISQNYIANQPIGIYFNVGAHNTISQNTITNNSDDGILINSGATNNTITQNMIYANGGLGIDLSADGSFEGDNVTANDANDDDNGANDLLNYPVISSAIEDGGNISVNFDLDVPAGTYRIEFFKNPSGADPSGYGEGEDFTAAVSITHSGGGAQSYSHSFAGGSGDVITTTATVDVAGDLGSTSEFSAAYTATAPPPDIRLSKSVDLVSDPFNNAVNPKMIPGALLTYTVTITNQGLGSADADTVIITNPAGNNAALFVGDLSGSGSAVIFQNGTPSSGLTLNNSQVTFSINNGSTFDYTPSGGIDYDPAITHLRVAPSGTFDASDGTNHPNFSLQYRIRVQ